MAPGLAERVGAADQPPFPEKAKLGPGLPVTRNDGDALILPLGNSEKKGRKSCSPSKHPWSTHGEHMCRCGGSWKREWTEIRVENTSQEDQ